MLTETLSLKVTRDVKARLRMAAAARRTKPSALLKEALVLVLEGRALHEEPSCYDLVKDLFEGGKLGRGPGDLSCNQKHLEGYGRPRHRAR